MAQVTEKTLEMFEKMDVETLREQAKRMGLRSDGEKTELIANLAAAGYNPEEPVRKTFPLLFINVKTCEPVLKVLEKIKERRFIRQRLPLIDRYGRVQRGFVHHSMPCKPETAKKLLNSDLISTYENYQDTLEEVKKDPDQWNFTWCQVRGKDVETGNTRYFVALHAQRKDFDLAAELEKYQAEAV